MAACQCFVLHNFPMPVIVWLRFGSFPSLDLRSQQEAFRVMVESPQNQLPRLR
jgi:hypothetical protein